jgi:hypothetical protein
MGLAFIDASVPNQLIRIKLAAQPEDGQVDQSAFPECPILRKLDLDQSPLRSNS